MNKINKFHYNFINLMSQYKQIGVQNRDALFFYINV